jgi:nicotinamide-nucleotide amidase
MSISSAAHRVARLLKTADCKVVFAESCTGGLVSGSLTKIPGISKYHCGGVVVYRNQTKTAHLGIPAGILDDPGPVSREVTQLMAVRVLERTPEADVAAAVTGHLGPGAPPKLDGLIFIAVAWRGRLSSVSKIPTVNVKQLRCKKGASRVPRQRWVVEQVLEFLADELAAASKS